MTIKRHFVKKAISVGLSATLALSAVGFSALAATSDDSVFPVTKDAQPVDDTVLTTLSQRAASEIPLVFGINVVDGDLFSGYIDMGGSDVSENPDPYVYNYNLGSSSNAYLGTLGRTGLQNADGLYSSGGGNQVYTSSVSNGIDVIVGFNSDVYASIVAEEDYSPLIIDVQTGSATSRLYAWTEMGYALSNYLSTSRTVRYGDPYTTAVNLEQFSAGIPYYIAYLIDNETLTKKTAAFVTAYDTTNKLFTCEDPADQGDVRSDMFAEVNNFDFVKSGEDGYTATQLAALGVDLVVLSATGYSYDGGSTGQTDSLSDAKDEVIINLASAFDDVPMVMSGTNYNVTIGNNGYNYSPITCMFMPYIQVYAYMDELAAQSDNNEINPAAMVRFMIDNFFHVNDDGTSTCDSAKVTSYYIGSNWDNVFEGSEEYVDYYDLDQVPDATSYVYDESAIEKAIVAGIEYALSLDDDNSHTLLAAYRTNDNAYKILNSLVSTTTPGEDDVEGEDYISLTIDDATKYIYLDDVITSYPGIVEYYGSTTYNKGYSLKTTLQNYADHMEDHVWEPVVNVTGTYGYGLT